MKAIIAAAETSIRNMWQFAFWTGLRTSELIEVRWTDIEGETLHIQRAKVRRVIKDTKTDAGDRYVKLLKPARDALKAQMPLARVHLPRP